MAEYADPYPDGFPEPEEGFEPDPYQQTIETEGFILTFTGPLADVIAQLERRVLLA